MFSFCFLFPFSCFLTLLCLPIFCFLLLTSFSLYLLSPFYYSIFHSSQPLSLPIFLLWFYIHYLFAFFFHSRLYIFSHFFTQFLPPTFCLCFFNFLPNFLAFCFLILFSHVHLYPFSQSSSLSIMSSSPLFNITLHFLHHFACHFFFFFLRRKETNYS